MRTTFLIVILTAFYSVSTALAAPAQDRVQGTFLGCRLGEDFRSVSNPERWECRGFNTTSSRYDGYFAVNTGLNPNVVFGGQTWSECRYYFSDPGLLYKVRFYANFSYEEHARARYRTVLKNLDTRYPEDSRFERTVTDEWEREMLESVTFTDEGGRSCSLVLQYRPSAGGRMYYYVFLYYSDESLQTERSSQYMEGAAVTAIAAYAQTEIQGRFLGLELGQTYGEMLEIPGLGGRSRDCCRRDGTERVCVEQFKRLRDIRFGGREWGNFNMYFSPGGTFYMVSMNRGFGTPGEAEPEYTSLLADLDSKYGRVGDIRREEGLSADGTRRSVTYTGSDGAVCTVSLERSEAVNNSLYWFVTLTYWREDLRAAAQEEIIREM